MTPPTPEELLRLARKAWPGLTLRVREYDDGWMVEDEDGIILYHTEVTSVRDALLVLSGELDVAALLAERDRLREKVKQYQYVVAMLRPDPDHKRWDINEEQAADAPAFVRDILRNTVAP
jgi:hypothetical protein